MNHAALWRRTRDGGGDSSHDATTPIDNTRFKVYDGCRVCDDSIALHRVTACSTKRINGSS